MWYFAGNFLSQENLMTKILAWEVWCQDVSAQKRRYQIDEILPVSSPYPRPATRSQMDLQVVLD